MSETETRPRNWKIPPRRDETRRRYVSRPSRDRDVETETTSLAITWEVEGIRQRKRPGGIVLRMTWKV